MKRKTALILLFFIILSYPFLIKYNYVAHNQYEQLPLILRYQNHTYLNNDWSLNLNAQFSPRIFFTAYMAILGKIISLPLAFFINYIFGVAFIAFATFLFSSLFFNSNLVSLLSTLLILYGEKFTLGGNDLIGRDFDPSRLAFSLVIFGFVLLLKNKIILGSLLFSMASYFHPLIGLEAPLIFYLALFIAFKSNWNKLRRVLKSVILYLLFSFPSFFIYILSFLSQNHNEINKTILLNIIAKIASPFHYLPSSWSTYNYMSFGIFTFIFFCLYRMVPNLFRKDAKTAIRNILIIISVLFISGYIFTEIIPIYFIVIAQFFRMTVILYWIFAVVIYSACIAIAINPKINVFLRFISASLPFILSQFNKIIIPGITNYLFIFLIIIISIILARASLKRLCNVALILAIISLPLLYRHYQFQYDALYPFMTAETKTALWVKNNLNNNAQFLVPPNFIRFRLIAQKPIVVDRLVTPFEEKGIIQWLERMNDISGNRINKYNINNENLFIEGYKKMDMERLDYLKSKYNFDYLIMEKYRQLPLPQIYSDSDYIIYDVK